MASQSRLAAVARALVLLAVALGSTGCARLFSSYDVAPNGMPRRDYTLRSLLATGRADSALARVAPEGESAPEDELLRSLYSGILTHYLGAYDSSSVALERAAELAEDRYTKRVSRAALSLVTNDKVLPYEPGEAERLLIHYYAALNYLRRGDTEGAAVEARRLGLLFERLGAPRDSAFAGWLRYFSGVVFEAAGERNDAEVAYRNARALLGAAVPELGVEIRAEGARGGGATKAGGDGVGEVLVLVEEGFVAHRVEQSIVVPLYGFELDRLSRGETSKRLEAAASLTARIFAHALIQLGDHRRHFYTGRPHPIHVPALPRDVALRECARDSVDTESKKDADREKAARAKAAREKRGAGHEDPLVAAVVRGGAVPPAHREASRGATRPQVAARGNCDLGTPYLLRIAWPVFRREQTPTSSVRVMTAAVGAEQKGVRQAEVRATTSSSETTEPIAPPSFQLRADLSDAVARDFEAERGEILARTIVRGVTKVALTRRVERAPGKDAEGWGRALAVLFNLGSALLEQADTRSWQLLPDRLRLIRLELPPGEHALTLEVTSSRGTTRRIDLGTVQVRAGDISVVATRYWR